MIAEQYPWPPVDGYRQRLDHMLGGLASGHGRPLCLAPPPTRRSRVPGIRACGPRPASTRRPGIGAWGRSGSAPEPPRRRALPDWDERPRASSAGRRERAGGPGSGTPTSTPGRHPRPLHGRPAVWTSTTSSTWRSACAVGPAPARTAGPGGVPTCGRGGGWRSRSADLVDEGRWDRVQRARGRRWIVWWCAPSSTGPVRAAQRGGRPQRCDGTRRVRPGPSRAAWCDTHDVVRRRPRLRTQRRGRRLVRPGGVPARAGRRPGCGALRAGRRQVGGVRGVDGVDLVGPVEDLTVELAARTCRSCRSASGPAPGSRWSRRWPTTSRWSPRPSDARASTSSTASRPRRGRRRGVRRGLCALLGDRVRANGSPTRALRSSRRATSGRPSRRTSLRWPVRVAAREPISR